MDLTRLERDILTWIAKRNPSIAPRLLDAKPTRRERAAAFFTYLTDGDRTWDRPPIDGPSIVSPLVAAGGGSMLWLSAGRPACLEVYTYGENFDEDLAEYELVDR